MITGCKHIVECSSSIGGYTECESPVRAKRIWLKEKLTDSDCKKNKDYGLKKRRTIFVKDGCSGVFVVSCKERGSMYFHHHEIGENR